MVTVALCADGTPADLPGGRTARPRRLRLSRAALEHLAARAGTELPWARPAGADMRTGLDPVPGGESPYPELDRELGSGLASGLGSALRLVGAAAVAVDVDVSVRRDGAPGGWRQLRCWHRWEAGRVTALATSGGAVEVAWFTDDRWQAELARVVTTRAPEPPAVRPAPPRVPIDLPYELLLGSGEALRIGREDVLAELVGRSARLRVADDPIAPDETAELLGRLHTASLGRMRTVVSGGGPVGDRRVGWVSWSLFADGWRAWVPARTEGVAMVQSRPVEPLQLGPAVARLVAQVRR